MLPDLQYQSYMIVLIHTDGARSTMFNNKSEGKDVLAKQEGSSNEPILPKHTSTSRQWAGFKNPRIVRVSKAFGGKDRHSKVCTVKGLRDRRIRLSVPTALQLYDLQDRLGLNQPSKVIDWLLDSTKDDIDKLPPLQMLPGDFSQFHQAQALIPQDLNSPQISFSQFLSNPNAIFVKDVGNRTLLYTKQGIKHDYDHDISGDHQRMKGKEVLVENKWNEQDNGDGNGGLNFFPIPQYSYPGMFPYNPSYNLEPSSNISISQFGNQGLVSDTSMALPLASPFFLCPPAAITPSPFPPYLMPTIGENHDLLRQNNNFHMLSSSSQHVPPNSLMPLLNRHESQEKVPFSLDAHPKVRSQKNGDS